MAKNNGNGAFVFGVIVGAIGGAIGALLLTPRSGESMRQEISSKVTQTAGPALERTQPFVDQGKERASELIDRAAERAQDVSGKIAAMDLPFQDDDERAAKPASTPPSPAAAAAGADDPQKPSV